jgi:tryptophan synthase beta chain
VSAGLDYAAVGPEHAYLHHVGRVRYETACDDEALATLDLVCRSEGILPALESSHAIAGALRLAKERPGARIVVGVSGRGDKDLPALLARGGAR